MLLLLPTAAFAAEMLLSPGGVRTDDFAETDQVAWLDYDTDCAGQVLDLPDEAELPVQITAIRIAMTSPDGAYDHHSTAVAIGLKLLDDGAEPTGLPGFGVWDWPELWFELAISSQHMTEISLTNHLPPTWPLTMEGGRLAVWVCPADPEEAAEWPHDDDAGVHAGLLIDSDLPSEDSYLWVHPQLHRLSELGVEGGWVIQAVAEDERVVSSELLSLIGISPDRSNLGEVAEVSLSGTSLTEELSAFIGGLGIAALEVIDEETMTGRSPSGLPVGLHDVRVVDEEGQEALLTSSFEVLAVDDEDEAEDTGSGSSGGCGCSGAGGVGPWLLSGLVLLIGRRRRSG